MINAEAHLTASQLYGKGLMLLDEKNFVEASRYFRKALSANPSTDLLPAVQSYLGYALVMGEGRDSEGFKLLHQALTQQFYRPEFFFNLAKAYLHRHNRKQALNTVFNGLKYIPQDPSLTRLLLEMGVRKPPPLRFLRRGHFLNRWLGLKFRSKTGGRASIHSIDQAARAA